MIRAGLKVNHDPEYNPERESLVLGETDTHFIDVIRQVGNQGLVCTTPKDNTYVWDEGWYYTDYDRALSRALVWLLATNDDEPIGWTRHRPSNRRRENGDPALEEIRP